MLGLHGGSRWFTAVFLVASSCRLDGRRRLAFDRLEGGLFDVWPLDPFAALDAE